MPYQRESGVVLVFVLDEIGAWIENRDIEVSLQYHVEHIEDTTGATVAVQERMNRLELVVEDSHIGETTRLAVVEVGEVREQPPNDIWILWLTERKP
jgi:hypothetical protein